MNLNYDISLSSEETNSNSPAQESNFRGQPISWIDVDETREQFFESAFGDDVTERWTCRCHYIEYCGQKYCEDDFMKAHFAEYKKYPYKVDFKTKDIFRLSYNQRAKLQYHILSLKFPLVDVDVRDKVGLSSLSFSSNNKTAQNWRQRMKWDKGIEKMITFGMSLGVQGDTRGLWCYKPTFENSYAEFCSVEYDWDLWLSNIAFYIDSHRHEVERAVGAENKKMVFDGLCQGAGSMLYYQQGSYLTLPTRQANELKKWIYNYCRTGKGDYPYHGNINTGHYEFRIEFDTDIDIVEADDRKTYTRKCNEEINKGCSH